MARRRVKKTTAKKSAKKKRTVSSRVKKSIDQVIAEAVEPTERDHQSAEMMGIDPYTRAKMRRVVEQLVAYGVARQECHLILHDQFGLSPKQADNQIYKMREKWKAAGKKPKENRAAAVARLGFTIQAANKKGDYLAAVRAEEALSKLQGTQVQPGEFDVRDVDEIRRDAVLQVLGQMSDSHIAAFARAHRERRAAMGLTAGEMPSLAGDDDDEEEEDELPARPARDALELPPKVDPPMMVIDADPPMMAPPEPAHRPRRRVVEVAPAEAGRGVLIFDASQAE